MPNQFYIYTTLTNDHAYTNWTKPTDPKMRPQIAEQVLIKGGVNLPNEHLITPLGMRTAVTDKQMEALNRNKKFLQHKERGFIVIKTDADDPEKVARRHMEKRDNSAPLTPQSEQFRDRGEDTIKPITTDKTLSAGVGKLFRGIFS